MEEERKRLAEEIQKRRAEFEKTAKDIIAAMVGKERGDIKAKLHEAKIPEVIIKEVMPTEGAAPAAGAEGAKGTAPKTEAKPGKPEAK